MLEALPILAFCPNWSHRSHVFELRDVMSLYEVVRKEGVGRCLVAKTDISAGQLILSDDSVTWGPKEKERRRIVHLHTLL